MIPQHGRLEISRSRLRHNVELFRARVGGGGGGRLCATVKANAYGHGLAEVLSVLQAAHVDWACVYSLGEALHVATRAPTINVLVLAPVVVTAGDWPRDFSALPPTIRLSVNDAATARVLAAAGIPLRLHIQFDAGLTRSGATAEETLEIARLLAESKHAQLEGVFAHFSHGDEPGHATIHTQLERLRVVTAPLKARNPNLLIHLQNSGGAWNLGHAHLDLVRVGIGLYGLQPSTDEPIPDLRPIARLTAPILDIHSRPAGVGVGYGHTFVTTRPSRLAIVPVGYADGYPRCLSNQGVVQIRAASAPVVGRVSMDQIIIDITEIPAATVGDQVIVISHDPAQPNSVDRIAQTCGTIGYEVATGMGARLERVLVE